MKDPVILSAIALSGCFGDFSYDFGSFHAHQPLQLLQSCRAPAGVR